MTVKSNDAETINRINRVYQLLIQGWHRSDIVQFGSKEWGVSDRSVDEYIRRANTIINANAKVKQKRELNKMLNRHDDMRSRAYKVDDLRLILDIDREDAKILGLYQPEKKNISGSIRIVDESEDD